MLKLVCLKTKQISKFEVGFVILNKVSSGSLKRLFGFDNNKQIL